MTVEVDVSYLQVCKVGLALRMSFNERTLMGIPSPLKDELKTNGDAFLLHFFPVGGDTGWGLRMKQEFGVASTIARS